MRPLFLWVPPTSLIYDGHRSLSNQRRTTNTRTELTALTTPRPVPYNIAELLTPDRRGAIVHSRELSVHDTTCVRRGCAWRSATLRARVLSRAVTARDNVVCLWLPIRNWSNHLYYYSSPVPKSVLQIWRKSSRALPIRQRSSRQFFFAYKYLVKTG